MSTIWDSYQLKGLTLRNRICVPPMVCYHWSDESGLVSDRHVAHYQAIARGGAGLIIQEATCVSPEGKLADSQLGIWSDEQIPGLRRITAAVHREGTPILVQLHHAGFMSLDNPALCPSDYTHAYKDREQRGREMTLEEIVRVREAFVEGARRAQKAGYDGVEIHGCHGYLLCQFMNQRVNRRQDAYGEPMKLVGEILDGIRKAVGPDFIVGIRLGVFEPGLADGIAHARWLEAQGIDFLDLSYGFSFEMDKEKPEDYPLADVLYGAGEIRKAVSVPVFAVYGIQTPEQAQQAMDLTGADLIDIGRGTLVNYDWVKDAQAGRNPGRCLYCKDCMWRIDTELCAGRKLLKKDRAKHAE